MAVAVTLWALGHALRALLHFALLPTRALVTRRPSRLSNVAYRTTSIAVDAAFVIVPALLMAAHWS